MKKYFPTVPELVTGAIIVVVGMVLWNFVGAPILGAINTAKSKVTG